MGGQDCVVKGCKNTYYNSSYSFFRFPKDINRARLWLNACGRTDLLHDIENLHFSHRLCGLHFDSRMFLNNYGNRLQPNAIPTRFLGEESSQTEQSEPPPPKQSRWKNNDTPSVQHRNVILLQTTKGTTPASTTVQVQRAVLTQQQVPITATTSVNSTSASSSSTAQSHQSVSTQNMSLSLTRKWELKKIIRKLENENTLLRKRIRENITKYPNASALCEIASKTKGEKYSDEFMNYCLTLYFLNPNLYKGNFAAKLCLPDAKVLRNFITESQFPAGLSETTIEFLKKKFENFPSAEKQCFLCLRQIIMKSYLFYGTTSDKIIGVRDIGDDEREFKPASRVLVIMIKGLYSAWEQPIAYYFEDSPSSGKFLKKIVMNAILKLGKIKLKVRGVICNMKSNYIDMAQLLGVTPESPYFSHFDEKVVFLYNTDDLLTITRDDLMYNCFVTDNGSTGWSHIRKLYLHDKTHPTRAVPDWTDSHVFPTNAQKSNVKYASEIFTDEVAAAMNLYERFKALPRGAKNTSEFIKHISGVHSILNGSCNKGNFGKYWSEHLEEYLDFFNSLKVISDNFVHITSTAKSMVGWKTTIRGIMVLRETIESERLQLPKSLRINHSCLKKFFNSIQYRRGEKTSPTPIQFYRGFKRLFSRHLIKSSVTKYEDYDRIYSNLADMPTNQYSTEVKNIINVDLDYQRNKKLATNFTANICDYLIEKCHLKHTCDTCQEYTRKYKMLYYVMLPCFENIYSRSDFKLFEDLTPIYDNFIYFVASMDMLFQEHFENLCYTNNIIHEFTTLFNKLNYQHPCPNFPYYYAFEMYARVRLFYTLKNINRNFNLANNKDSPIVWKQNKKN